MAAIISVSLFPRYLHNKKHMEPIVVVATKRVLYDDMTVTLAEITAAEYEAAIGPQKEGKTA